MAAGDPGSPARYYSSIAVETALSSSIPAQAQGAANTSFIVATVSGFPSNYPYTLIVDPDTSKEEVVTVTAGSGTTLSVIRGEDNTQGVAHSAGAVVRHGVSGRDFRESENHIAARGYDIDQTILDAADQTHVHGIATGDGVIVGTLKTQTLTNKTLTSPTITNPSISGAGVDASIVFEGATADAHETTLTVVEPTQDNTITLPNTTGTVVLATAVQTLTNKTMGDALNAGGNKITNLATPTLASDAVRKDFADAQVAAAATSAASAATSASSAATSASSALTSANSAAASATAAATSAASAATSASTMSASVTAAATSAASAAASATAAATSATSAAASATAAATSATSAAASATAAATSATNAAASATTAAASVASIATYASNALASQNAAATSATNAATSASSALTSQTAAATSATSAAASATAAATSATSAAASATAAATSATSAAASATAAAGYVVPSQTGNAGKFLGTDGTAVSWTNSTTGSFGVGEGIGSDSAVFQIGNGRTADGNAYIDLIGDTTYTDYGLRIIRGSGANGVSQIIHRGTNNFALTTTDAANMLLQTNATTRMVIDSAGKVAIGATTPSVSDVLTFSQSITGSTSSQAVNLTGAVQSDVTTAARGFNTFISTAAAAFTLSNLIHFRAGQGTFGAGSTVTNQYGFYAETTLTGAGTNIGFYGNIPAGSGRFNFYAGGTAGNYFAGRTGIGTTLTGTAMAAVFNTTAAEIGFLIRGAASQTGDLLTVQDSAATNLARITSAGNVGIGITPTARLHTSTLSTTAYGLISQTPVVGLTAGNTVNMAYFADGRSAANDGLRIYNLRDTTGANNGDWQTSSFRIQRNVDGVAVQGEIAIGNGWLSLAGASGEVMRVTGASVGIGTTSPSAALHVSSGSGARVRAGGATGSGFEFNDANTRFDIPAANTIAAYTSNAERMRIDSAGNVGIGGAASTGRTITLLKNMTGNTVSYGINNAGQTQSDVTSNARMYISQPSTQAAAFTVTEMSGFYAGAATIGAGSAITSQYGFIVGAGFTGATNNYGFMAQSNAATGVWNFYASGTAANHFAGRVGIGSAITTTYQARITNVQSTSDITLATTNFAAQTADSLAIQNSAGSSVFGVTAAGFMKYSASNTATTVGAAGGASALPATPTGYLKIDIGGTEYKVPYYAA